MGKKQSFIPWYLLSNKLIEMGCNSCICSRHLPNLTPKCGKLSPVKHSKHQSCVFSNKLSVVSFLSVWGTSSVQTTLVEPKLVCFQ